MLRTRDQRILRESLSALVATGQRVSTDWIVVTGAPGAGKSSVIDQLGRRGHRVVTDPARGVLEERVLAGLSKHEARSDYGALQTKILNRMLRDIRSVTPHERVFFDYALPDNLAFLSAAGLEWGREFVVAACSYKYQFVFLLDIVSPNTELEADPIRVETLRKNRTIQKTLRNIYRELGIPVTRVPIASVDERADYLLCRTARRAAAY